MPLVRMLVSWGPVETPVRDRFSNTLYFNVSGSVDDPDYQDLADDLRDIYATQAWTNSCRIEVRAYDMRDAKPRPERAFSAVNRTGSGFVIGAGQVALCLSYYADRNLPSQRGRIYTGPWAPSTPNASDAVTATLISLGQAFAGLGGVNVDWSLYSPTKGTNTRISNIWVDNSWDVVRSRKQPATRRAAATING